MLPDVALRLRACPAVGKIILDRLGDIEMGIRQLIRTVPLETQRVTLPSGRTPLADRYGIGPAAWTLAHLDEYFADQRLAGTPVGDQVARQLAGPRPADLEVTRQVGSCKQLAPRWTRWSAVTEVCGELAKAIVEEDWL